MDQSRPAAERVRPILNAMERSIDAARQQRLRRDADVAPRPAPVEPASAEPPPVPLKLGDTTPRLKARPKRASLPGFDGGAHVRSQAG